MTIDTEKELIEKINEIHGYIFGVQGRPGVMETIQEELKIHSSRLESLENLRWYITGGFVVLMVVARLVWPH